jgi:hypothetical protein
MYQWLKSGSLKRPISDTEEDNTVNDMNEVQVNNSCIYLSKKTFLFINSSLGACVCIALIGFYMFLLVY